MHQFKQLVLSPFPVNDLSYFVLLDWLRGFLVVNLTEFLRLSSSTSIY